VQRGILDTVISGARARNSHAQVVQALGRSIIAGRYPVGSTLPGDAELAALFGVSRTVLRETMKTLAAKGLIVARARIGTRVTPLPQWNLFDKDVLNWYFDVGVTEEFMLHISEIRMAFEPHAAALTARQASSQDIARIMALAQAMDDPQHDAEALAFADLKFHLAILDACGNPFMRNVGSLIEAALTGVFKLSSPAADQSSIHDVAQAHIRIVDAIAAHDEQAAREAMENVIRVGRDRVVAALEEKQGAPQT